MHIQKKISILFQQNKIFKFFFILCCLFGNCKEYSVKKIQSGEHLDKAEPATVDFFFQNRMKNSIKKVLGRIWEIVRTDEDKIYFGYLLGDTHDNLYLEKIYYINKQELEKEFPGYKKLTGIEINREIHQSSRFQVQHNSTIIQDFQKTFSLSSQGIEVFVRWKYSVDGGKDKFQDFRFILDKTTGKLLEIQ